MQLIILFFLLIPGLLFAQDYQLLQDQKALALIEEASDYIYDSRHAKALKKIEELEAIVPEDHPVLPLIKALNYYWQDMPMSTSSPHFNEFSKLLDQTIKRSEKYLEKENDVVITKFFALTAHSLLARYYADEGKYIDAIGEAKATYGYMKDSFDLLDDYKEFYFVVGLYNYYREKYPEVHPIYKPMVLFFRSGDTKKGLEQLEYSVNHNTFTKSESGVFLAHIYLYYENKPKKAVQHISKLFVQYPNNLLFRTVLAESYIASGQFEKAQPHVTYLLDQNIPYFKMAGQLFAGRLTEEVDKNYDEAKQYFEEALTTAKGLSYIADTYRSMAYAGLARYYVANNQKGKAKEAYKKAISLTSYPYPVKQEAEKFLK